MRDFLDYFIDELMSRELDWGSTLWYLCSLIAFTVLFLFIFKLDEISFLVAITISLLISEITWIIIKYFIRPKNL